MYRTKQAFIYEVLHSAIKIQKQGYPIPEMAILIDKEGSKYNPRRLKACQFKSMYISKNTYS